MNFTVRRLGYLPPASPCYKKFEYLRDWDLKNDEPTKNSLVFFIPRLVAESKSKNVSEQFGILAALRERLGLPGHHLSSFGQAGMLSGLILANFKRTGNVSPLTKK